ncbi:MAG: hypothetical protein EHM59_13830 [Betaproteobacteria bacterium]|nr:MAG: hypothetical protein EHM59_13830 [Betaproteobacteria bacterium]
MLDSIVFEQHGIPSASIITDVFQATGRAMARTWGLPNFRFVMMPHPIANLTDEQLDQRARDIAPKVIELLREGQPDA